MNKTRKIIQIAAVAVDPHDAVGQHVIKHHVAQPVAALGQRPGLRQGFEAKGDQHLQGGDLRLVRFGGVETHACRPCRACSRHRPMLYALPRIGNFPVDMRVLGLPGPFCFFV